MLTLRSSWKRVGLLAALSLMIFGCPHRSPVWSPDQKHILLLAGGSEESVDKPATAAWLIDTTTQKAHKLPHPAAGIVYVGATWIADRRYAVLTAEGTQDQVKDGSEAVWTGEIGGSWRRLPAPVPSADRSPRRVLFAMPKTSALVYSSGTEAVVVVDSNDGKELARFEPAELVGPGPKDGVVITRADGETGGLEIVALGADLKPLWTKKFSALTKEIAQLTGKKTSEIVINDTSTTRRIAAGTPNEETAVTFVYTDVSWREGIPSFVVRFDGRDGATRDVRSGRGMPGRPAFDGDLVWAVAPKANGDAVEIRAFAKEAPGPVEDLAGLKRASIHGFDLSPDSTRFAVSIAGPEPRLLLFPIEKGKVSGKPVAVGLKESP